MGLPESARLRVAAIDFLNPAPLLYSFEHAPTAAVLARRYDVRYTSPAQCAAQLRSGEADLGLVPIAALPTLPNMVAVPGCVIASHDRVRSIQLVLRPGIRLQEIRSIAADAASRSSAAYVQVLLRQWQGTSARMHEMPAALKPMLAKHDAALLIGDPALLALEQRDHSGVGADCTWMDVAAWWHMCTGLPWVAAVWAVRPGALQASGLSACELVEDLSRSRDEGLAHVDTIVRDWSGRIALPAATIRSYLTENIHYVLDEPCDAAIGRFFALAAQTAVLPPYEFQRLQGCCATSGVVHASE